MRFVLAHAQQAAPESADQRQAAQQAFVIQEQAYQQAMMDCMGAAFPVPGAQGGRPVDPAVYRMTDDKMQIVIKCMDGKGIAPPVPPPPPGAGKFVQNYLKKNSASSRQMVVNQANNIAAMWKREAEVMAGDSPGTVSPATPPEDDRHAGATDSPVSTGTPAPKIYNAPASGDNVNGGKGPKPSLWVVPQKPVALDADA